MRVCFDDTRYTHISHTRVPANNTHAHPLTHTHKFTRSNTRTRARTDYAAPSFYYNSIRSRARAPSLLNIHCVYITPNIHIRPVHPPFSVRISVLAIRAGYNNTFTDVCVMRSTAAQPRGRTPVPDPVPLRS